MRKIIYMLTLISFLGIQSVFAQTTVTGTVTSADDGSTLPGVSVAIEGTSLGTTTDMEGKYSLSVPEGTTALTFSFIGMEKQTIAFTGQTVINVEMKTSSELLDEVVVVAYGVKTKRAVTGAISSVDSEVLDNQTALSPVSAIQGVAAGVNVITSGGQPGENPSIRIRGIGSVNASSEPLIVLDGVVFSGNLNAISSDQIETINVLKDASSAALYGSRASNGVLLITTKGGGRYGKRAANITVNMKGGFSSPAVKGYDYVGAEDYMKYSWESIKNSGLYYSGLSQEAAAANATSTLVSTVGYNPYGVSNPIGVDGQPISGASLLWDTDWYGALIRENAFYNDVTFSADGAGEDITYFISANHVKQEGSVIASDFERTSARVNLQVKLTDWLDFGTNNSFSKSAQNYPTQSGSSYRNTMQWVNTLASIYPIYLRDANGVEQYDNNGDPIYDFGNSGGGVNGSRLLSGGNAVFTALNDDILYIRTNLFSASYIKAKLYDGLTYKTTFGYERYLYDSDEYGHYLYGDAASVQGRVSRARNLTETTTITNALNYKKEINEHSFGLDIINEIYDTKYEVLEAQGTGFLPDVTVLSGSTVPEYIGGYLNQQRLVSFMGRADYSYKSRYYVDFSYRMDASTQFKAGNRWGKFYSGGLSWIASDENFIKNLTDKISLLKFRTSYGELGNNAGIGYFPYFAAYETGWSNNNNIGVIKGGVVDEYIRWEKTAMFNIALDFGIFKDRITGTIEYYNKNAVDLIFDKPIASSLGSKVVTTNIGDMSNKGFEFAIKTVNVNTPNLYWNTSFNIATNKNTLTKLPQDEIVDGVRKLRVGRSLYDFFIQEYAGVDPATGEALWYKDSGDPVLDENGVVMLDDDGKIIYDNYEKVVTSDYTEASKYYVGSSLPKLTGGFTSYLKYKNFDLNVIFNYAIGAKMIDYSYQSLMSSLSRPGQQLITDIADRWQTPGDITDVPKLYNSNNDYNSISTRFLFDNDYLRLKALTIGYTLPKSLTNRINISGIKVYVQADNIWTLQTHKGIDPEQSISGTTNSRSYIMKTISAGLKVDL